MSEPHDKVITDVLRLVRERYLEPARVRPDAMLTGALNGLARCGGPPDAARPAPAAAARPQDLPALDQALRAALHERAEVVRADVALAALLGGALSTLDRWSSASTGTARRRIAARYSGTLVGLGVRVGRREGVIRILEAFAGGGGEAAGLRAGDELLALDGKPVGKRVVRDVVEQLRGPAGTTVRLDVRREGVVLVIEAGRRAFDANRVTTEGVDRGVGLVRIAHFSRRIARGVADRLRGLERDEALTGIVVDLRGNQGGSMLACAETADLFVEDGLLVQALGRDGEPVDGLRSEVRASGRGRERGALHIALAIDDRTASCAELFAATMVAHDRAILVGRGTFGKRTIQKVFEFDEVDLTVKLSTAYMHAAGTLLPEGGLAPDVAHGGADAPALAAELLRRHGRPSRRAMLGAIRAERDR